MDDVAEVDELACPAKGRPVVACCQPSALGDAVQLRDLPHESGRARLVQVVVERDQEVAVGSHRGHGAAAAGRSSASRSA
jgi:hypothetical protein